MPVINYAENFYAQLFQILLKAYYKFMKITKLLKSFHLLLATLEDQNPLKGTSKLQAIKEL